MSRILLVDDVKLFRHLESTILGSRGYTIEEASDGTKAIEKIQANPPDLVLTDLYMPGIDGAEVCRRIKSNPATNNIPVIVITSSSQEDDIRRALQSGCDDYLTKPIDESTLIRKTEELLGRVQKRRYPRVAASMQISFEDFKGIFFGYTRDISRTGVFIEMSNPLLVGTRLFLSFSLPPPHKLAITVYGKVVRRMEPTDEQLGGVGVNFICLHEDSEKIIESLVSSQSLESEEVSRGFFSRVSLQAETETDSLGRPPSDQAQLAYVKDEYAKLRSSHDELQSENFRLSAFYTLLNHLHAENSPKQLISVIGDVLHDLVGVAASGIFIYQADDHKLILVGAKGLSSLVADKLSIDGPIGKALESHTVQIPATPWQPSDQNVQITAVVPILWKGQSLGVITLHELFSQKTLLTSVDRQLLNLMCQHVGPAVFNAVARIGSAEKPEVGAIIRALT